MSSLNNLKKGINKYDPALNISLFIGNIKEENLKQIQDILLFKEQLTRLKESLKVPSRFDELKVNAFENYRNYSEESIKLILNKISYIEDKLEQFNQEKKENNVALEAASLKTLRKISYLSNLNKDYLWTLKELFESYENINRDESNMFLNQIGRQASLPIETQEDVLIKEIVIGSNSIGIVGNPDGTNNKITNLLTKQIDSGFSFYSKENSKVELNLVVHFTTNEIVNFLHIEIPEFSKRKINKIEDITFIKESGEKTSIKSLNNFNLNFISENSFELIFLPFVCKKIELKFKQSKQYFEDGTGYNQIDLSYINFKKIKFKSEGKIVSKELSLFGENYLSANLEIEIYPKDNSYSLESYIESDKETLSGDGSVSFRSYPAYISYATTVSKSNNIKSLKEENDNSFSYDRVTNYFNPEEDFIIEEDLRSYTNVIKSAHIIKDTFRESRRSESFYLGFQRDSLPDGLKLKLRKAGELQSLVSVPSDGVIRNGSILKTSLEYCLLNTTVSYVDGYYYFDAGEFLDLDNISLYDSVNEEEVVSNYKVILEDNNVSSIAFSKTDVSKFLKSTYKLSEANTLDNLKFSFGKQIIKNTLVFKDDLLDEFTEKTFVDGSSEFQGELSFFEEQLPGYEISSNNIIAYELSKEAVGSSFTQLKKQGELFSAVEFADVTNPNLLDIDKPTIDIDSNVLYIKTSESDFFANYSIKYQYAASSINNAKMFSVDYKGGVIHFNQSPDQNKRVSFESNENFGLKFDLALYNEVDVDSFYLKAKARKSPVNTLSKNLIKIYLGKTNSIIDIEDINEYYSPIISRIGLSLT